MSKGLLMVGLLLSCFSASANLEPGDGLPAIPFQGASFLKHSAEQSTIALEAVQDTYRNKEVELPDAYYLALEQYFFYSLLAALFSDTSAKEALTNLTLDSFKLLHSILDPLSFTRDTKSKILFDSLKEAPVATSNPRAYAELLGHIKPVAEAFDQAYHQRMISQFHHEAAAYGNRIKDHIQWASPPVMLILWVLAGTVLANPAYSSFLTPAWVITGFFGIGLGTVALAEGIGRLACIPLRKHKFDQLKAQFQADQQKNSYYQIAVDRTMQQCSNVFRAER